MDSRKFDVSYQHPEPEDEAHAALMVRVTELGILQAAALALGDEALAAGYEEQLQPLYRQHEAIMERAGRLPPATERAHLEWMDQLHCQAVRRGDRNQAIKLGQDIEKLRVRHQPIMAAAPRKIRKAD